MFALVGVGGCRLGKLIGLDRCVGEWQTGGSSCWGAHDSGQLNFSSCVALNKGRQSFGQVKEGRSVRTEHLRDRVGVARRDVLSQIGQEICMMLFMVS